VCAETVIRSAAAFPRQKEHHRGKKVTRETARIVKAAKAASSSLRLGIGVQRIVLRAALRLARALRRSHSHLKRHPFRPSNSAT